MTHRSPAKALGPCRWQNASFFVRLTGPYIDRPIHRHTSFSGYRSLPWADKWRVAALLREGLSGGGGVSMAAAAEEAAMADQSACMRERESGRRSES